MQDCGRQYRSVCFGRMTAGHPVTREAAGLQEIAGGCDGKTDIIHLWFDEPDYTDA